MEIRDAQPTIGFIGLGEMGEPMARHLLQHGFPVVSCANRRRKAIEALAKEGLVEAENPAGVGAKADIFMTIVVDQAQTEQVLRGPTGALSTLRPGSVIIIMSTIDPDYCKSLAQELAPRDIEVIDCPVSGGPHGAVAATLALMTGGAADVIERCRAPLEAMGTIFPCGEVGMGMGRQTGQQWAVGRDHSAGHGSSRYGQRSRYGYSAPYGNHQKLNRQQQRRSEMGFHPSQLSPPIVAFCQRCRGFSSRQPETKALRQSCSPLGRTMTGARSRQRMSDLVRNDRTRLDRSAIFP